VKVDRAERVRQEPPDRCGRPGLQKRSKRRLTVGQLWVRLQCEVQIVSGRGFSLLPRPHTGRAQKNDVPPASAPARTFGDSYVTVGAVTTPAGIRGGKDSVHAVIQSWQ
jgi:hypothetical protein